MEVFQGEGSSTDEGAIRRAFISAVKPDSYSTHLNMEAGLGTANAFLPPISLG